jgi:hypothetical protein
VTFRSCTASSLVIFEGQNKSTEIDNVVVEDCGFGCGLYVQASPSLVVLNVFAARVVVALSVSQFSNPALICYRRTVVGSVSNLVITDSRLGTTVGVLITAVGTEMLTLLTLSNLTVLTSNFTQGAAFFGFATSTALISNVFVANCSAPYGLSVGSYPPTPQIQISNCSFMDNNISNSALSLGGRDILLLDNYISVNNYIPAITIAPYSSCPQTRYLERNNPFHSLFLLAKMSMFIFSRKRKRQQTKVG